MNRQREIIVTVTYNELGIIIDTKAELRKTGRWIYDDNDWSSVRGECSVCGWKAHVGEDDVVGMDYCPNCGSRLLIGKDGD